MENLKQIKELTLDLLKGMDLNERVHVINTIREFLHEESPFKNEPVDFVKWVKSDNVIANEYNPNKVAPPEMQLLEISITNDGYTQPIVTFPHDGKIEVVDGFHRNRVGKESKTVWDRIKGYLPIGEIRKKETSKNDRISSSHRSHRAMGKWVVVFMPEIVLELKNGKLK